MGTDNKWGKSSSLIKFNLYNIFCASYEIYLLFIYLLYGLVNVACRMSWLLVMDPYTRQKAYKAWLGLDADFSVNAFVIATTKHNATQLR